MKRLRRYLRELQEFDSSMEAVIAEFDAANLYEMMADLAAHPKLKELFMDIAEEEKVHIGEFESALEVVDPNYESNQEKGEDEGEDVTGWDEEGEDEYEEGYSLKEAATDIASRKAKMKEIAKANKMRCRAILVQINKRREEIKGLLLQARQWECGE